MLLDWEDIFFMHSARRKGWGMVPSELLFVLLLFNSCPM
jgi:hypothetical protein